MKIQYYFKLKQYIAFLKYLLKVKGLILKFPAYQFVLKNYGFNETTFLSRGIFPCGRQFRLYRLGMTLCCILLHALLCTYNLSTLGVCTPPSFLKQ